MQTQKRILLITLLTAFLGVFPTFSRADLWVTAYYPGYGSGVLQPSEIDFSTVTHVVHFAMWPNGDGSLLYTNGITTDGIANIVSTTHAAGRQVLFCIGGAGSYFANAASSSTIPYFVTSLTNFMATNGYDGIDVDWEPLPDGDGMQYTNLIYLLRSALDQFPTHKLLTSALPPTTSPWIAQDVQNKLDQMNIMTYDLSGPYPGWVTWYNSAIFNAGQTFPTVPDEYLPSIDGYVTNFLTNGIAPGKMGIGAAFYGYVWAGGNGTTNGGVLYPDESWTGAPTNYAVTYDQIMSSNFPAADFHYDTNAQAAYISVSDGNNGPSGTNDMFISYDDTRACASKVSYARNKGLGGLIIWDVTQDHVDGQPDPLLSAIKTALASPGTLSATPGASKLNLNFATAPLGQYVIQWTTNLMGSSWNSLLTTNVSGTNGSVTVADPGFPGQSSRYYRVVTPP